MKPAYFPGCNLLIGEGQPQYTPLPAMRIPGPQGEVITCFELTEEEAEQIMKNKKIYFSQLTYNTLFQPIRPMVDLDDGIRLITKDEG